MTLEEMELLISSRWGEIKGRKTGQKYLKNNCLPANKKSELRDYSNIHIDQSSFIPRTDWIIVLRKGKVMSLVSV